MQSFVLLPRTNNNTLKYTSYFTSPNSSLLLLPETVLAKTHKNSLETKELRGHEKTLK